ncbi:hypothetical protein V1292_004780 [Bradyrhizobium sp. AZCC 1719]|uniref:hypothetical protein n=1 Tax=Bradyrhizobium sp. AZCC 1719 TaxID=3117028 RepID=UPI002FF17C4F
MRAQWIVPLLAGLLLNSCGTYVPDIQEFPGDTVDGQLFVKKIVENINCEITEAVRYVVEQDKKLPRRTAAWFDDWGIQTTLTLTTDEKGSITPVVNWLPPSPANSIFNLAGTGTVSSTANRIDKLNSYNSVQQFLKNQCVQRPGGPWILSSDLKLREWIVYVIMAANTGEISIPSDTKGPLKSNVISHQIRFIVSTSGGVTPGWKLSRVSINQGGSFLAASRDRTHDLTITLGPMETVPVDFVRRRNGRTETVATVVSRPSSQAAEAHLASEIGSAVANSLRSSLAP